MEDTTANTDTTSVANDVQNAVTQTEPSVNPFDFTNIEPEPQEQQAPDVPNDTPYVLDMGTDYDGNQETTDMITQAAQKCGLDAGAAGQFVGQVCAGLKAAQDQAVKQANEALMKEWGSSYDSNMKGAGQFLAAMARQLGIEDTQPLMNPAVFRLAHAMRQMGGEKMAAGTTATDTRTSQQRFDAIMADPSKQAILMNPMHPDYKRVAAEANACMPSPLF